MVKNTYFKIGIYNLYLEEDTKRRYESWSRLRFVDCMGAGLSSAHYIPEFIGFAHLCVVLSQCGTPRQQSESKLHVVPPQFPLESGMHPCEGK